MEQGKGVEVIGAPVDLGANIRGANMGPAAIRIANLKEKIANLGYRVLDSGDLMVPVRETIPDENAKQKYLPNIVEICDQLRRIVKKSLDNGNIPVTIGGDHCLAIGTITGVAEYFRQRQEKFGVIWVDAHADLNTPATSPSGNIHGMPLSCLFGNGHPGLVELGGFKGKVEPNNVALIGIRTLDAQEVEICRSSGIRYYTMRDIDERGMPTIIKDALAHVSRNTSGIHLSFDIDGIDPIHAPGVSTPVTGGISLRESHLLLETIADSKLLRSMEFVELNPIRDTFDFKTATLVVDLVLSALGKSII